MPDDYKANYNEILQSSVKENLPVEILERFEVTSCLAFDEKKELYLVRDRQDRKKGILRVTKGDAMGDAAAEAGILHDLDHPAISKVIGQWSGNDRSFLLREYFEGATLRALVQTQGVLKADQIMDITIALCDVLSYIHGQKPSIIHRDIKPDNIILTKEGEIKLIDFGDARKYLDGATKDTQIVGTEPYMAPEQYGSEQTDGRADIFSLGVVMVFLATGEDGKRFLNDSFPYKSLAPVIEKCIKTDRNLRFQNAERLKKRILRIRQGTTRKIILCATVCAAVAAALLAGLYIGEQRGFDRGVEWLMSSPAATINQYTVEELNEPIVFNSWYIDMAVRNILNKEQGAPIYLGEVLGRVSKLQIAGTYIIHPALDITITKVHKVKDHVEYWTSDNFQITDRGDISDLSDVSGLYYLRELELPLQSISDLSPLSGMKLERIVISNNFVGNLLPLKDMATLRELDVCQNPLDNLTPISRLLSLEYLDISQTQVTDLKPLKDLTKLKVLNLAYCDVKDISMLAKLPNLRELDISNTFITDLTPLLDRTETITIRCDDLPDEVIEQVRGAENVIILAD